MTMKRREFIAGSTALVTYGISSGAMAAKQWRIGEVFGGNPGQLFASAIGQALRDLGYVDGKDFQLQVRFAPPTRDGQKEAILALLPDIDLLVVHGTLGGAVAKSVTSEIPVVFISVGAPVDVGLVESLAHPGGNMTGTTFEAASETYGKRLQLLKEILPELSRVAVLGAKGDPNVPFAIKSLETSAPLLGVSLSLVEMSSRDDLQNAFDDMKQNQAQALVVIAGVLTFANSKAIAELALTRGLPSCHGFKETVAAGGLISLGPDLLAVSRQGAGLVDKIIRGARPADLPVEQPTQYVVTLNLKTAKTLGITVPPQILARADEVIE
jgi:putative ABC transport system substrate-binding protein